jgi:hypothetical protein
MKDYKGLAGGYTDSYVEPTNMFYQKRIGLDIYLKNSTVFSFDIKVGAKLKQSTSNERISAFEQPATSVFVPSTSVSNADINNIM